jgi:hypothetical protein
MYGACSRNGGRRNVYRVLVSKSEVRVYLGDPVIDVRILLRWIFRKWNVGQWTGSRWTRIRTGFGYL